MSDSVSDVIFTLAKQKIDQQDRLISDKDKQIKVLTEQKEFHRRTIEFLQSQLSMCKEALEFYADIYNWSDNRNMYYFDCAHVSDFETIVLKNGDDRDGNKVAGKRARETLNKLKNETE